MIPKPIPAKLIREHIGIPAKFTAPPGKEDEIGDLEVLMLEDTRAILQGAEPSIGVFVSWWSPSAEEIKKLNNGAPVRLSIIGATHINPMNIEVANDLEGILFSPNSNEDL